MESHLNYSDLFKVRDTILEAVDPQIRKDVAKLHKVEKQEVAFFNESLRSHPLSILIHRFNKDAERSTQYKQLHISSDSYIIIQMYDDLLSLKSNKGRQRIIQSINNPKDFYSGVFELRVAGSYTRLGYDVEVIQETVERTPDFKVFLGDNHFYVECKSLQNKLKVAEKAWERLAQKIHKIARSSGWQFGVMAYPNRYLTDRESDELAKTLEQLVSLGKSTSLQLDHSLLEIKIFRPFKQEVKYQAISFPKLDFGRFEFAHRQEADSAYMSELSYINVKDFFSDDYRKAVKRQYDKAKEQLPHDSYSVLHLEIPFGDANKFIPVVQKIEGKTYERVNRKGENIDLVVLSAFNNKPNKVDDLAYLQHEKIAIPSHREDVEIPNEISLFGEVINEDIISQIIQNPSEGTVCIEFDCPSSIDEKIGNYIYSAVSRFGLYQIRIGILSESKIRVYVVTPILGFLAKDFLVLDIINKGSLNKLAVTFSPSKVKAAMNGQILRE